ncbi:Outer membrane receptor proteins, mostly Fe transport [Bacteroides heparinolyticus]|uniref:Outer membrane receptor proteins, mostly Fe transport n=1 Tax=Prevotella heparinolytica TaxID=28113 RepID=A0A449I4R4_9BACE|nr:TonB-dependent receptor [Bacteroides heparinolyticus]VFB14445.1 Outer membrane receptor proteins, mostly Fe transport [Bacteroides heparinolyticus]
MKTHEKRVLFSKTVLRATACLFLAASTIFSPVSAFAETVGAMGVEAVLQQAVTVTGVVTDKNGEPVIGANVLEKGTTNGVITDLNGHYTLKVKDPNAVLSISYIGYKAQEIPVGSRKQIDVVLTDDTELLDEVVVIGYGTQKKGDVTSAITSVKAEDFTAGKIGDAAELIKGKVAGLTIAKGSGDPNAESTIRLRGVISLKGGSTPLVLIDGIEGGLGTVAPENIVSIDVLKDASAAAIYGTRGANGVILITTKSGAREARTSANYSGYMSLSRFGKTLDFFSADEIRQGLTNFTDKGHDTDWLDAVTRKAFTHNHNFNISGGSKSTTYSADFTYRKEEGVILDTYNEEMKMSFDVSHWMLNDMLKVNFNLVKTLHKNGPIDAASAGIYRQAIMRNPTEPIWNEDGTYYENFAVNYYYNPVGIIREQEGKYTSENTRMTGNVTFEPIKNWQTNLMLSRRTASSHNRGYYTSQYFSQKSENHTGYAYHSEGEYMTDNLEITSKYNYAWDKHRFNVLAGYSYQYNVNEGFNANNYDFPSDFYLYNNLGLGTALKDGKAGMGSYKNDNKLIGFFGRVSYGYDDKYNVLISVRREGSSKFGDNNKWATFPSVSLGWTISNEKFMSSLTWVDNLKLRVGYGVTGVIVGDSYNSLTRYTYGSPYFYDNGVWKQGLSVASNPNPDLKWETSKEVNIGFDWAVLNERLSGSIDVYQKKTSDMLWDFTVPTPPNLYNRTLANAGKMRNQGIEVAVNAIPVQTKDFEWKTTVTASHNTNELLSLSNDLYETSNYIDHGGLGEPISLSTQRMEVGKSVGQFFGMKSVGVSENGLWMVENAKTGEIEEFTDNMLSNDDYRQYLGSALPKLYLGWTNSFKYKNIDLSFQMTGQFGFKILNEPRAYYENNSIAYNRLQSVKQAPYGGQYRLSSAQKQTFVSYYLENGDFLKMSNITLGYNIPLKGDKFVKNIRAYVSADNLFCITGYDGLDPEMSNGDIWYLGIDWRDKYPSTRSFTFGLNVAF